MQNVVPLPSAPSRPARAVAVPQSGARILFFTGVRYVRDVDPAPAAAVRRDGRRPAASEQRLDAASH